MAKKVLRSVQDRSPSLRYPSTPLQEKSRIGDLYDWTTGAPHDGNEWKKYRVVPRAQPSAEPFFVFI